jgi:hypothetical protein
MESELVLTKDGKEFFRTNSTIICFLFMFIVGILDFLGLAIKYNDET